LQSSRIDDQRTELPVQSALTVPDQDLFNLVQKMQSSRMNEQRSSMPKKRSSSKKDKKDKK
jgi:G-protein signaling modulator 2